MMRFFIAVVLTISFLYPSVQAEDRNGILNQDNKESSSFVVDPDPLDPLPVKKENIKDGDEIILDDIRQVIDAPAPAPRMKKNSVTPVGVQKIRSKKSSVKVSRKSKTTTTPSQMDYKSLSNDEPDSHFEDLLHISYQKFNINPTSTELWSNVSSNQKQNIYTVQKNDTLYTISKTLFGDSKFWPKIWALNRSSILNPHYIYPNMKIYFYSGDAESLPTLSLEVPTVSKEATSIGVQDTKGPADNYFTQNTEFQKTTSLNGKGTFTDPTAIPESLPISRNDRYNTKIDDKIQIDLKNFEYIEDQKYSNPYILTSSELKSDFLIPKEQISNLVCVDSQFIPVVVKNNADAAAGNYVIVEKLENVGQRLKATNKYKTVGTVKINDKNQMRVSDCRQLMDISTIIVSDEKIKALSDPSEDFDFSARIIDGLDYQAQDYYAEHQYLVINLEGLNVDTGADLSIFSDDLGKRVGRIRILRRTGTVAVAVVTQVYDIIHRGDTVTE